MNQNIMNQNLIGAIERNDFQSVRDLLDAGADPNANDGGALFLTVYKDDLAMVRLFLAAGANPNIGNNRATMIAATNYNGPNSLTILRELLAAGGDPNVLGGRLGYGRLEVVRELLTAGADPNLRGVGGYTTLIQAAMYKNLPVIRELLEWGADPTLADSRGFTPLDYPVIQKAWREFNGPRLAAQLAIDSMNLTPDFSDRVLRKLYRR